MRLLGRSSAFLDLVHSGYLSQSTFDISDPVHDLVDLLRTEWDNVSRVRILLFTDADMSARIRNVDTAEMDGKPVSREIWDLNRLYDVIASAHVREPVDIDFSAYLANGVGLPCLEAPSTSHYHSYLCIVPGTLLADLFDKYGGRLLESNVRGFLSTSRAVNRMIRGTIRSSPEEFFVYNNGIAATARALEIQKVHGVSHIVRATDLQIVNGGQTTASLSNTRIKDKVDLSAVAVQMKLTMVTDDDADDAADFICRISRSSNSQTKVSEADFASLSPFHVRMEQISRRMFAPAVDGAQHGTKWFYERAAGQYLQAQMGMTQSGKKVFARENPKAQKFTKTDLAKARNSWEGKPHIVSKGAQANFADYNKDISKSWDTNDQQFNDQYFQDSVALRILFKQTEKLISQQDWYTGGYRANIVTYTLALLHSEIRHQYENQDLDLRIVWRNQSVPDALNQVIAGVAKVCFEHITSPSRKVENITQWCKRAECWALLKEKEVAEIEAIEPYLITKDEARKVARAAQADQHIVSDMEAQAQVVRYPPDVWRKLFIFAKQEKILRESDMAAFRNADRIPSMLPTGKQCTRLLALLREARALGFAT